VIPDGSEAALAPLIDQDDAAGTAAIRLVGAVKLESLQPKLKQVSEDPATAAPRREAAMGALVQIDKKQGDGYLESLAKSDKPYTVRAEAAIVLSQSDVGAAAKAAAQLFHGPAEDETSPLFIALIRKKNGPKNLADAMKNLAPSPDAAKIGLRELRTEAKLSGPLTEVLAAAANVATENRASSPEEIKRLLALVQKGDPNRGEEIFRSVNTGCMNCHAIAGAGGDVGPDLSTVGTTAQPDFLIEHILAPSKHVKDGFTAYVVETSSGDSITGVQVRETPDTLVLRDATHEEMPIAKNTIKKRRAIGTLMPTGLADMLTDAELADLVKFLSVLGKPGPFDVGHASVERRWLLLDKIPAIQDPVARGEMLADKRLTWVRHFTNVAGELRFSEVPGKRLLSVVLRGNIDVTAAGPITLALNSADRVELWVDGKATPAADKVTLDLPVGQHTLDFWVDVKDQKTQSLRASLDVVAGSNGRAQWAAN
jgi:putative heme-binding domain-containing protein